MEFAEVIQKPRVDGVYLWKNGEKYPVEGSIVITGHHLIFQPSQTSQNSNREAWLLLHKNIDLVVAESKTTSSGANSGSLTLKCKNFLIVTIEFRSFDDCQAVSKSVEILSNLTDIQLHYPFFYQCSFHVYENGWDCFNLEQEDFARLQIQSDFWRVSYVNKDFSICPSYPEKVVVPKQIGDDILKISSQFRDGGRFPILSYYHRETKSVIVRCGQPAVGSNNRRCREDEQLLNAMLNSADRGYIIDTRSQNVVTAAKAKGYGVEPEMHYSRWKRVHKATPRWQTVQESLARLIEACNDNSISSDKWLSKLTNSGWLQNVADVLTCACVAAQCLDREGEKSEMSVVVHGSEGTDSTIQVVSLVQVILDPDCRTMRGFEALVEREWVQGGHPFASRCAHSAYGRNKNAAIPESPMFLLFLDCVWQIYQQFRCSFEFTDKFLITLFEHSYASEFGTFLCNNEKEKIENNVKQKTVSLWSHLNRPEIVRDYMNPFYEPNKAALWPSVAPQSIELWQQLYCRWTRDWSDIDEEWKNLAKLREEERKMLMKVTKLRRQLASLEKEAKLAGITIQPNDIVVANQD